MSNVFLDYSKYYDLLNQGKNYKDECGFVKALIEAYCPKARSILNIGCGTGEHDRYFKEMGYAVEGIDLSEEMLNIARRKNPEIIYTNADARSFSVEKKFDVIVSLFHVLSYQNSNQDVLDYLTRIEEHLAPNGIAIFDYWYGPAVLNLKPENRTRSFDSEQLAIQRHAKTELNYVQNIATVHFDISVTDKTSSQIVNMSEEHPMRFFFTPELHLMCQISGLAILAEREWLSLTALPSQTSWSAFSVVTKK